MVLRVGGVAATGLGQYDGARASLTEALELGRSAGVPYWTALALSYLGDLARCEQDFAGARPLYEESVALLRELGHGRDGGALHNLAHACPSGRGRAAALFRESLLAQQALENASGVAEPGLRCARGARRLPGMGARLLAAAAAWRRRLLRLAAERWSRRITWPDRGGVVRRRSRRRRRGARNLHPTSGSGGPQHPVAAGSGGPTAVGDLSRRERNRRAHRARPLNSEIAAALISKRTVESTSPISCPNGGSLAAPKSSAGGLKMA
jgi:hypothetical protein